MTAPRFADCVCCHPKVRHDSPGLAPQCVAEHCQCIRYRPQAVAPTPSTAPAALRPVPQIAHTPAPPIAQSTVHPSAINIEALLREGKDSSYKNIVSLAERIAVLVVDLRGRLHDERVARVEKERASAEKDAARREIADLEAKLAAAKAKLRGDRTPPSPKAARPTATTTPGSHPCPVDECERVFDSAQAIAMHKRRAHEGFDPRATKAG